MRVGFSLGPFLGVPSCPLWLVYLLFFLSGISGLLYEVVWLRMLTRILGNTEFPLWRALLDQGNYRHELNAPRLRDYLELHRSQR